MLVSFLSQFCSAAAEMAHVFLLLMRNAGSSHVFCHQIWVRFQQQVRIGQPVHLLESVEIWITFSERKKL